MIVVYVLMFVVEIMWDIDVEFIMFSVVMCIIVSIEIDLVRVIGFGFFGVMIIGVYY